MAKRLAEMEGMGVDLDLTVGALMKRLGVTPGAPSVDKGTQFFPVILMTASIDTIAVPVFTLKSYSPNMSSGFVTVMGPPAGERWHLWGYDLVRTGGDRNCDRVRIANPGATLFVIDTFTAASERVSGIKQLGVLEAGWNFAMNATGGTTDGAWSATFYVQVEQVTL